MWRSVGVDVDVDVGMDVGVDVDVSVGVDVKGRQLRGFAVRPQSATTLTLLS